MYVSKHSDNQLTSVINGLFLLLIAVSGNFLGDTFTCKIRDVLSNNIYAKYLLVYFVIYFTLSYTNNNINSADPFSMMGYAAMVWVLFICFTRMNVYFTLTSFILLIILSILNSSLSYLDSQEYEEGEEDPNEELKDIVNTARTVVLVLIVSTIVGGVSHYAYISKGISWRDFIFGKLEC